MLLLPTHETLDRIVRQMRWRLAFLIIACILFGAWLDGRLP